MELIYMAVTVKILASTDIEGRPEVDVYPMEFTTRELCNEWRNEKNSALFDPIDHVTGKKIMAQFHECTPYRPKDIEKDIEKFRARN